MRCNPTDLSVSVWAGVLQFLTSQQLSCSAIVGNTLQQFERELQYGCSSDCDRVMGSSTKSSSSAVMENSRPSISVETDARDQSSTSGLMYC